MGERERERERGVGEINGRVTDCPGSHRTWNDYHFSPSSLTSPEVGEEREVGWEGISRIRRVSILLPPVQTRMSFFYFHSPFTWDSLVGSVK
jgi:hypothetical protein